MVILPYNKSRNNKALKILGRGNFMDKKLAVIVGVGKGMGFNIAKVFGEHNFKVAMLARNSAKLNSFVEELKGQAIEAFAYTADAADTDSLTMAFQQIKQ